MHQRISYTNHPNTLKRFTSKIREAATISKNALTVSLGIEREKVFRGLKKVDSSALTGIKLYHNYTRPHMSLDGDTLASRARIDIKGDKWMTIIENASKN